MKETVGARARDAAGPVSPPGAWERHVTEALGAVRLSSLKSKIIALALIAMLLPALAGWLFYVQNKRLLSARVDQELQSITSQASRDLDLRFRERLYDIRVLSTSSVVTDALERRLASSAVEGAADRKRLEEHLRSVCAKFTDYEELVVVDAAGNVLATSADKAGPLGLPEGWIRRADADKPVLGHAYHDATLGKAVVVIGEPIRSPHDRFMGLLAAKLNFEGFGKALEAYSTDATSEARLIDREGRVLAGSSMAAGKLLQAAVTPAVAEQLFSKEGGSLAYEDSRARTAVGSVKQLQQFEWGVLAQLDRQQAYAQVVRARNITIGLVASLILAIGLAAYLLGLTIVRPLARLAKGSAKVVGGDLSLELPVLGGGEVAYLTGAFNNMVQRLFHTRRELDARNEALRETSQELQALSTTDSLTGLHNRHSLMTMLSSEVERSRRNGRPLGLLMIDVDHFKKYNDAYGHLAGDDILRSVAGLLESEIRSCDHAARYGGEEFVVILPEADLVNTMQVAERIRRRAEDATRANGGAAPVTLSLGISLYPKHANTPEALLREADTALYEAKRAGRNGVAVAGAPVAQTTG